MKNIPNPYAAMNIPDEDIVRIQADVSRHDRNLLRAICPEQGIYTFTLSHILIKLCHELRKRNITDCTRESEFRNAILGLELRFPNGTASGALPQAGAPNDGGGVETIRPGNPSNENKPSSVPVGGGEEEKGQGEHGGSERVRHKPAAKGKKGSRGV